MTGEGFFYTEPFTDGFFRLFQVDQLIFEGKTKYQLVHCFRNRLFGKMLFLDKKIQSAEIDEFVFHEALVHPGMFTHALPKKVLVIGGGEGATLREVLRHASVKRAVMLDIDRELVSLCREHMPEWSQGAFSDSRTKLVIQDARRYLERTKEKFDVIVSDLTEPLRGGPSLLLFTKEFFSGIHEKLNDDGLFVIQAGSADPHYCHFFASSVKTLGEIFPVVRPYWTFMFSFSLPWGFILASKASDPLDLDEGEIGRRSRKRRVSGLKFYHPGFHSSLFSLPLFLTRCISQGKILTDREPFIWEA